VAGVGPVALAPDATTPEVLSMVTLSVAASLLIALAAPADQSTTEGFATGTYRAIKDFILRSADKMPPEHFGFQPTPEVRSFGQVLAHIADGNYLLCSYALGEPNPNGSVIDKTEKAKLARDPVAAKLKDSFAFCDRAYGMLSAANADEQVAFFGGERRTRVGVLWFHISHAFEHYGNAVTYMRLHRREAVATVHLGHRVHDD
jgi:uncharacterized damage-inducible protein DinB